MIVPFGAGGAPDIIARFVAQEMGDRLGQRVIVENRPGASGNLGAQAVARAAPDGYTILLGTPNPIVINKLIGGITQGFDPEKALSPIVILGKSASVIVTAKDAQATSLKQLLDNAKRDPGKLTVGVPGMGTSSHVAMELLMHLSNTKFSVVPYRGTPSPTDILSGQITVAITPTTGYISLVNEGALRALTVSSLKRSTQLPDVPTVQELGYPGFEATTWYVLMAPTGTPEQLIKTMNDVVNAYLASEKGKQMLQQFDVQAERGTPEEAKTFIAAEAVKWAPIVKAANIKM
jgi:tripartite-type tricarboxylate transporter receptor subunit TctC